MASNSQSTANGSNWTPRSDDADGDRDRGTHRADADPGDPAAEQHDEEVARADVDVLQHPVALAIVEDRPGETGDPGEDERPERRPDDDEPAIGGVGPAADDVEDDDEDQRGRHGLRDRVDEEEERVRPVRLHLPAELRGRPEARPTAPARRGPAPASDRSRPTRATRDPGAGRGSTASARHCHRIDRRPSRRARLLHRAQHPAGRDEEDDGHRDEDERLHLRRRRAERHVDRRRTRAGASHRGRPRAG